MSAPFLVETAAAGVRRFVFNQPERRNPFDAPTRAAFDAALEDALDDPSVRALIITGAGGSFCAGGDVSSMGSNDEITGRARMEANHRVARRLARAGKPVVAAVAGWAMGAGAGLALLCDAIIADDSAKIGFPFFRLGLVPDYGIAHTLALRVGWGRARRILLHAQTLNAAEALAIGLVDRVVPQAELTPAALAEAEALAAQPAHAFAQTKALLHAAGQGLDALLDAELQAQVACFLSADHREGVAAFREKRPPDFTRG